MMPTCAGLLELMWSRFGLLKFTFNAKILFAGCLGLSLANSPQFTLKLCAAVRNHEQFTKTPNFGGSESFKVITVDKTKKPVISADKCLL